MVVNALAAESLSLVQQAESRRLTPKHIHLTSASLGCIGEMLSTCNSQRFHWGFFVLVISEDRASKNENCMCSETEPQCSVLPSECNEQEMRVLRISQNLAHLGHDIPFILMHPRKWLPCKYKIVATRGHPTKWHENTALGLCFYSLFSILYFKQALPFPTNRQGLPFNTLPSSQ